MTPIGASLLARDLRLAYPLPDGASLEVLDVARLALAPGTRVGVAGPSGSGKTSLLHVLTGIEVPQTGEITWAGVDITRLRESERDRWRRATVGFVFQDFHLFSGMSALDNVLLPATFGHGRIPPALARRARELLARVGVERGGARVETLSRGEMQRVACARALLLAPGVVVADEPTASLDTENASAIGELLLSLCAETFSTLLVVSHDRRLLDRLDTVHTLVNGRLGSSPQALTRGMINPLPVVLAELRRSRAAAAAAIGLVAVAAALGVAVTAQERALRQGSARAADPFDLLVARRGSPTQLVLATVYLQPDAIDLVSAEALKRLQVDPGAARVVPLVFGDSHRGQPVVGASADFVTDGGRRPLAEGRVFAAMREVVVGWSVPLRVGASFAPTHGHVEDADALHAGFTYVVVGRMPRLGSPWDRAIVAPVEALWRVHARPTGHAPGDERIGPPWDGDELAGASVIVVKPRSVADAYRIRARYREGDTMAVFPAEVLVALYGMLGDARRLLSIFALVTQTLVIAAVLLAVFAVEAQRRRQLGVLRALGASRAYVFSVVWLHVTLLVGTGGVLGLLFGWLGAFGVSGALAARTGLALPVAVGRPEIGLVAALIAVGGGLAALPAWRCYRRPASALLRS